ncbi:GntR family transcriptional regulator [Salicibibacter cibarius]|uniref:GntR family transcriptional regulator n=1 Tax=Salicibibacter cibarius TaxID=2743000 RepID=A0A7T6Z0T7_9BACI|nr:GntR family transcriptional regulator [Salicibibacter cibarius]QQK74693.1 GntR family transcriptional regulator [Salicibibacter cibarius]
MSLVVKSEPFHIQAYKNIKNLLLANEFSSGEQLTEIGLARKLGVSRGPVREAIRMLLQDGLVIQKGVHIHVLDPTFKDVEDLYLCRKRLEPLAAGLATEKMLQDNKNRLIEIIEKTKHNLKMNELGTVVELNTKFHELIVHSSENQQLIQFMDLIAAKTVYMRNSILRNYTREAAFIEEHEKVAQAILNNNKDQAELEMTQHIQNDLEAFYPLFEKTDIKDE